MVKRIITNPPGYTFSQFSLLTRYSGKECSIPNINLETRLAENLNLQIPLISAAMRSVTGYEMALELGKAGGLGVLPARLPIEEQVEIVEKIKSYEMSFVDEPIKAREIDTVEKVLGLVKQHGHSRIPVADKNNYFLGMFVQEHFLGLENVSSRDLVTNAMIPFDKGDKNIPYCEKPDLSVEDAKALLARQEQDYLVVLDDQGRVEKLAFTKDVESIKVASAITTREGWQERVEANKHAGVDLFVIDTSDAYNYFSEEVIIRYVGELTREYRKNESYVPLCAGNIMTYEGAMFLMEQGADIIKGGIASGSICTTQREKAVGRAPLTVASEMARAQNDFSKRGKRKRRRYVPTIIDGGISSAGDMVIALTLTDAIMMGNYFNRLYEAAGEKLDKKGKVTTIEQNIEEVVTYGEGSEFAQNLERYGHESLKTFFPEGEEGTVPYAGRLKPNLKGDLVKIKAAMVNPGCMDLESLRRDAVIELMSEPARQIVGDTHGIKKS